jgi:hypothetical protein
MPVQTAFVVLVTRSGDVKMADLAFAEKIKPDVIQASDDAVYGALSVALKDVLVATTAQATIEFQMAQVQAMSQRAAAAQAAASLDPRKMRSN